MNQYFKLTLLLLLVLLASCKSKKMLVDEAEKPKKELTEKERKAESLFEKITQRQLDYTTLDIPKLSVKLTIGGKSFTTQASMKIYKDSAMLLSIQPFIGIEMFRVQLSKDSIKYIDRMSQQYAAEDMVSLQKILGVDIDYYILQALFTNQLFKQGVQHPTEKDFLSFAVEEEVNKTEYTNQENTRYQESFSINKNHNIENVMVEDRVKMYKMSCTYNDFIEMQGNMFPTKLKLEAVGEKTVNEMDITYQSIKVDTPLDVSLSVPKKYKKISLPF